MLKVLENRVGRTLCTVLIILISLSEVKSDFYFTEAPAYVLPCKIYQPEFTKCSTNSIQKLLDQIFLGVPEISKLVGPLDPIKLDEIKFDQDNNEVATISANLSDVVVTGFSKMKIKESRVSKKDFSWQTKIFLPKMRIDAKYKMAGRVLLLPLSGAGKLFIEIENVDILMHTKTRLHEKGDFTFYNVTDIRVNLQMTGVKTYFDNLFNGRSKEVERSTNEFFNENWRDFFEALRPLIEETVARILKNILHKTFQIIPANFLVEDIPTSEQLYGKKN